MAKKAELFRVNIRKHAALLGMTYADLAQKANISRPYLSRMLAGKSEPTLPVCEAIASAMGTSLEALLAETQPIVAPPIHGHKMQPTPEFSK